MNVIHKLFDYFRPMTRLTYCFTDLINGKPVYLYVNHRGVYYLAQSRWARRRVQTLNPDLWLLVDGEYETEKFKRDHRESCH